MEENDVLRDLLIGFAGGDVGLDAFRLEESHAPRSKGSFPMGSRLRGGFTAGPFEEAGGGGSSSDELNRMGGGGARLDREEAPWWCEFAAVRQPSSSGCMKPHALPKLQMLLAVPSSLKCMQRMRLFSLCIISCELGPVERLSNEAVRRRERQE